MKTFQELREAREPFIVYDPENGDEVVGTASDEKGAKAIISSAGRPPMSHPNPKALKIAKSRKKQHIGRKLVEESVDRSDDDWVVVGKGRKPVRFLKNPKNNKAPRNWQKSSDEQEVIRVSKAKQMGIIREAVGDTALAFQTPYGTVTATKRNTKVMRGKQDGYSLSLKTKSGKTVDLGSHPKPTKANVLSIVKNVMS